LSPTVFLLTPPFTQLNTPYPATAYLKGFLKTRGISAQQADLGIEVILAIFNRQGLTRLFAHITGDVAQFTPNAQRILALQHHYIQTIDTVVLFLQGKNPTAAHLICQTGFLPEASRFLQLDDMDWAFGVLGTQDKAKHLATLYLEDLSDLIQECVDPHFGFSRYAERLGRSANSFDALYAALQAPFTYMDHLLAAAMERHFEAIHPKLVAISVPFPGNLYAAFRCGQWLKQHRPDIKVAMGGGFANTELRSLSEPRVFEFFDFITLDDGEAPIEHLVEHLMGTRPLELLKRAFALVHGKVEYLNHSLSRDYKQLETGTPDYSDLWLDRYISVLELANPMHRLWSDGRWNKLTMAHGCYWGKCTFCDISLDYIKVYEPLTAQLLCDRMQELIDQTGQNGFHFVDEAAPPALMRALALEIIRRRMTVTWWTNIRFEKSFTADLCQLLRASGCIAVSGGLEVASDRLLELIQKGVTVAQVARVNHNFTQAGIMVHAYLMYGFPTQTAQETIDSLEMVRQMFANGILQSGFWHQFAMTAHSPVGLHPEKFGVKNLTPETGTFANNDLVHTDPSGADHEQFSYGLKKSLLNYMHHIGLEYPLKDWFDFKVPRTTVSPEYIQQCLQEETVFSIKPGAKMVWLGGAPQVEYFTKNKKGRQWEMVTLRFYDKSQTLELAVDNVLGTWLVQILAKIGVENTTLWTFQEIKADFEQAGLDGFEPFWYGKQVQSLRDIGLLAL
jgi:radical SAM superfamily enzyme YgiQ (UPF0313 family)